VAGRTIANPIEYQPASSLNGRDLARSGGRLEIFVCVGSGPHPKEAEVARYVVPRIGDEGTL
jgi:hypothetical protein